MQIKEGCEVGAHFFIKIIFIIKLFNYYLFKHLSIKYSIGIMSLYTFFYPNSKPGGFLFVWSKNLKITIYYSQ